MTASSIPTESRTAVTPAAPPGAARHPRGLFVLFAAEMWERFGFYTMLALFTLYLQDGQQGFGWTKAQATNLYANYLMFVYFSPLVGGWLADRKLGYRRAVMLGGLIFMAGYLLLTIRSLPMVYLALTCLVVGNGFFKPNVSAMVGNLYQEGSHLKDRAYNIFYMGINIGAFIAPLVAEAVKQHFGTHLAFGVAALGMVISVSVLWRFKRLIEGTEKNARLGAESGQAAAAISRPIDAIPHRKRIGALIVIYLVVIVFWMVFHQNGSTLTYWANDNTDWASSKVLAAIIWLLSFGSISIEKVSGTLASAINPFFVVTLTFPLVWFWQRLDRRGREPATTTKIMIGMFLPRRQGGRRCRARLALVADRRVRDHHDRRADALPHGTRAGLEGGSAAHARDHDGRLVRRNRDRQQADDDRGLLGHLAALEVLLRSRHRGARHGIRALRAVEAVEEVDAGNLIRARTALTHAAARRPSGKPGTAAR